MAEKVQRKTAKPARKRRPWQQPQIKSGRLFESNSLACGKTPPESGFREECAMSANQS